VFVCVRARVCVCVCVCVCVWLYVCVCVRHLPFYSTLHITPRRCFHGMAHAAETHSFSVSVTKRWAMTSDCLSGITITGAPPPPSFAAGGADDELFDARPLVAAGGGAVAASFAESPAAAAAAAARASACSRHRSGIRTQRVAYDGRRIKRERSRWVVTTMVWLARIRGRSRWDVVSTYGVLITCGRGAGTSSRKRN
jgi:hypothetical protein